jgi:arsenical pump membrane protein
MKPICVVAVARIAFLIAGSLLAVIPWRRLPGWIGPAIVAALAVAIRVVPVGAARTATDNLASPIAFLLLAVPLAVLLDRSGFFASLAGLVGHTRHLAVGLWILAALVTIVFNLDAAVVLLTPLYVRIAERHGRDPVAFGFIPALLASLASSVLPVSNLTNLIAAERVHLDVGDFIAHLALPTLAAVAVGGWIFVRVDRRQMAVAGQSAASDDPVDPAALRVGFPVVAWLLIGFVVGEQIGIPEWTVVAVALAGMAIRQRHVPWRHVPYHAAVLAIGLGVLATAAARHLAVNRVLAIDGIPGELATIGTGAIGANAINNLPALLVMLPGVEAHHERVWAVLLGVNLGPTLWVTGALSTLLWQATMRRLGHSISALRYARTAARLGVPAIVAAATVHVALVLVSRL